LSATIHGEDDAHMTAGFAFLFGRDNQSSGHAQVHRQPGAAIEMNEQILAAPFDGDDPVSDYLLGEDGR
jgi:hypothetical protein